MWRMTGESLTASGRVPKTKRAFTGGLGTDGLAMAEGDAALGEVVRGEFEGDFIAGEDADAIAPQAAGEVSEHQTVMFELNREFSAGEFLDHGALYFYAVFFTHLRFTLALPLSPLSQRSRPCSLVRSG